ncbi:unnamed protein product [Sympodiomycopsis kandeliae]
MAHAEQAPNSDLILRAGADTTLNQSPLPDLGLIRYAVGSTLLPQHVAELITNLSLVARVSLRATAFFLEVILEATKLGTGVGIGITRKALISAIGAARTMQAVTSGLDSFRIEGGPASDVNQGAHNALFAMLDKYTALGIYVVHHGLTMAELMTMSGITLLQDSARGSFNAAEASVRVLDGMFGSNETSRALSSFIDLVRKEFSSTGESASKSASSLKALASLTRAITTFAVVQAATHRRTTKTYKTRVLYDCTVLGEAETTSWKAMLLGPGKFRPIESGPTRPSVDTTRSGFMPQSPSISDELARSRSFYSHEPNDRSISYANSPMQQSLDGGFASAPSIAESLDFFCGDEGADHQDDTPSASKRSSRRPPRKVSVSRLRSDEEIAPDVMHFLQNFSEEEQRRGVVLDRHRADSHGPRQEQQIIRRASAVPQLPGKRQQTVWEVITETTEITETIEEHEEECRVSSSPILRPSLLEEQPPSPPRDANVRMGLASRIRPRMPFRLFSGSNRSEGTGRQRQDRSETSSETERDFSHHQRGFEREGFTQHGGYEQVTEDEQEWQEISRTLSRAHIFGDESANYAQILSDGTTGWEIPSAQNGVGQPSPRVLVVGNSTSSNGGPVDSTRQMRMVLKRVRKKLIKTTRVIATKQVEQMQDGEEATHQPKEPSEQAGKSTSSSTLTENIGTGKSGIQRAMTKAKSTLKSSPNKLNANVDASRQSLRVPARNESLKRDAENHVPPHVGDFGSPSKKGRPRALSHASLRSYSSRQQGHSTVKSNTRHGPNSMPGSRYPAGGLVDNLHRFMKYASACYGHNFMNILGIGDPFQFKNTKHAHANVWAFAHHVGIPFEDVLLSSYSQQADEPFHSRQMTPIVNFVAIDRSRKAVVLACRGTLGLSDVLVDLTCEYEYVKLQCGEGNVHRGIFDSASRLAASHGTVMTTIIQALNDYPDYGLVTVGHSLGAGVAASLALLWACPAATFQKTVAEQGLSIDHPPITTAFVTPHGVSGLPAGRPIHCYAFGPPAIMDADFSDSVSGLITSVVHNNDVVPCISIGTVRDFKQIAEVLENAAGESCTEILGRTIGLYQEKSGATSAQTIEAGSGQDQMSMFPTEAPKEERDIVIPQSEIMRGKTRNRAADADYVDPYKRDLGHRSMPSEKKRASGPHAKPRQTKGDDLEDWLWSLIKTMRAHAQSEKLCPPGTVLCMESFEVYVRMDEELRASHNGGDNSASHQHTTTAHRVILRACDDVAAQFAEPKFCRSLFRDHSPAGYEFCLDLLKRSQE